MKLFYCLLSVTFYCLFNLSLSESAFPTLFLRLFLSSAPRHYSDILSPKPPGCPHLNRYKRHKMIHNIYKCIQKTFYAASDVRDLYLHSSQQRTVESAVSFPKMAVLLLQSLSFHVHRFSICGFNEVKCCTRVSVLLCECPQACYCGWLFTCCCCSTN